MAGLQKGIAGRIKPFLPAILQFCNSLFDFRGTVGQPFTMQKAWVPGTPHLHEHLGQLIAYARVNGVKPPWS